MKINYTSEKNSLILMRLLKEHQVRKVVVSPGATNLRLVASMQQDPYFELYSAVDERSAAYMACGMASETNEPVMISCTGATSSRNYMPALTEAYYRKLPILAVTSSQHTELIGHLKDQVTNRLVIPSDVVNLSVQADEINTPLQEWDTVIKINKALLALKQRGGGPVHINLVTSYSPDFSVEELPSVRKISRVTPYDEFPNLPKGNIGVVIGSHKKWSTNEIDSLEAFCAQHNAVVFGDHTCGYNGRYKVMTQLIKVQEEVISLDIRLLIHIGEVSGDHFTVGRDAKEVWRVNPDGEIRDTYRTLTHIFEMEESYFLTKYAAVPSVHTESNIDIYRNLYEELYRSIPELPLSNIWLAKNTIASIPDNSTIYFGILTSLRSWNFFSLPEKVSGYSNVGGFGIDGIMSSLVGASLMNPKKLYFGVLGDLSFFYDMNSLGNHHIGDNLRILLVNNGKGCEFTHHLNMGSKLGEGVNPYVAAAGHFGNKSKKLVKHYVEDLDFIYLQASTKEEYLEVLPQFLSKEIGKSAVLEVFTEESDENKAFKILCTLKQTAKFRLKNKMKEVIGDDVVQTVKKLMGL